MTYKRWGVFKYLGENTDQRVDSYLTRGSPMRTNPFDPNSEIVAYDMLPTNVSSDQLSNSQFLWQVDPSFLTNPNSQSTISVMGGQLMDTLPDAQRWCLTAGNEDGKGTAGDKNKDPVFLTKCDNGSTQQWISDFRGGPPNQNDIMFRVKDYTDNCFELGTDKDGWDPRVYNCNDSKYKFFRWEDKTDLACNKFPDNSECIFYFREEIDNLPENTKRTVANTICNIPTNICDKYDSISGIINDDSIKNPRTTDPYLNQPFPCDKIAKFVIDDCRKKSGIDCENIRNPDDPNLEVCVPYFGQDIEVNPNDYKIGQDKHFVIQKFCEPLYDDLKDSQGRTYTASGYHHPQYTKLCMEYYNSVDDVTKSQIRDKICDNQNARDKVGKGPEVFPECNCYNVMELPAVKNADLKFLDKFNKITEQQNPRCWSVYCQEQGESRYWNPWDTDANCKDLTVCIQGGDIDNTTFNTGGDTKIESKCVIDPQPGPDPSKPDKSKTNIIIYISIGVFVLVVFIILFYFLFKSGGESSIESGEFYDGYGGYDQGGL
jgi:hypothetical protein